MKISGIILAAGISSRMGPANKLLLPYKDHTVIEEVLTQITESNVDDIAIVTGHDRAGIERLLAGFPAERITAIHNPDYRLGRAESIKCAVRHIDGKADAALFMVADKPGVTTELINRAIDLFKKERPTMLYIKTPSGRGHPVIFSKSTFGHMMTLQGDCVGNDLVTRYADDTVILKDERMQIDIDTEDDYRMLLKNESGR